MNVVVGSVMERRKEVVVAAAAAGWKLHVLLRLRAGALGLRRRRREGEELWKGIAVLIVGESGMWSVIVEKRL